MTLLDMPIILYIEMLRLTTHEKTRVVTKIERFIHIYTESLEEHYHFTQHLLGKRFKL